MIRFRGKKVAILGLSVEGVDSVQFFVSEGAQVICADRRTGVALGETYEKLRRYPVTFQLGVGYLEGLDDCDIIVRTPGMSLHLPQLAALQNQGKEITSLTKLFFDLCEAPIIGVTGTKGKGTTSSLIYEMVKAAKRTVYLGGNVGIPLLSIVRKIHTADTVVLELSSFQTEDLRKSPHIAVVLRTTQEHLANFDPLATNFHVSREAYIEAKKPIVRFQTSRDYAVLNADDPTSSSFAKETAAHVYYFSRRDRHAHAYIDSGSVFLKRNDKTELICRADEIILRGEHNLENIAAAALTATLAGVDIASIRQVARIFPGLPHRLEFVRQVGGVDYYDDSFSTVPETTIAAVRSFQEPVILIAGGSEKGSDFTQMGSVIAESSVNAVIVIGAMTGRIVKALKQARFAGKIITGCNSAHEVVQKAAGISKSGDVVLLSPACASFDMFPNYKERGKQFSYEVSLL